MEVPCGSNWQSVSDWLKTLPGTSHEQCMEGQRIILERMEAVKRDAESWLELLAIIRYIAEFVRMDREQFVGHRLTEKVVTSLAA